MLALFQCKNCGAPMPGDRPRALYCSKRCKTRHEHRLLDAYRSKLRETLLDQMAPKETNHATPDPTK